MLGGGAQPRKGRRGWIAAVIAAVVVVLIGGGGVYAVNLLSGGGTQPEAVLPGSALAYVRLDLDPAANQKLALFNIARKFTPTRESFSGEDPRQALFNLIQSQGEGAEGLDFARDVEPWLGSRIGVAVTPPAQGSDEPGAVVAVQVTDEAAARAGITKLMEGEQAGIAFREDYALVTETQALADRYAQEAPLADNPNFTDDIGAIGEQGVLSIWGDMDRLSKIPSISGELDQQTLKQVAGARFAGALRFDGSYAELAGLVRGATMLDAGSPEAARISDLPATTAGAVSVSGLGDVFTKQWAEISRMAQQDATFQQFLADAQQSGLSLPDDVVTLLGKNLTLAVDERGIDADLPQIGARIVTDPVKGQQVVTKIEQLLAAEGGGLRLGKVAGDGTLALATTQEYAQQLSQSGTLADSETFQLAVPDAGEATFAAFVDLDKLEKLYLSSVQGEERANLQVLRAVGISGRQSDSESTFSLRVLFN
ncbi:hypothetical protein Misp01_01670 [Microtetraspora sp. NBRC 13810]|nr:hypothetical protein Misp01_01670 [Microtetraspora sp. NBRC 13810]